jgi:glucose-1-phosphate thymidylyltransferase
MSLYAIETLKDAGITEMAIILGSIAPEKVQEFYADGGKFGAGIR